MKMQVYLVGGAVRDALLGLPVHERDWVVVGATPEQMLASGYLSVGRDFPVFLHPETREEYALARTERKTAPGYAGFLFHTALDVTLEDDLRRRDLTINAIAQDADGNIIDPYQGRRDLREKMLRHISPAFVEDPVRVLRIARFAARFYKYGFRIADETHELMQHMVENGEVSALVPERVWREWQRGLETESPEIFLTILQECGALSVLFPEMADSAAAVIAALQQAGRVSTDPRIRFATLGSVLSRNAITALARRYKIPNTYKDTALMVVDYLPALQNLRTPSDYLALLLRLDAIRRPARLTDFLQIATSLKTPALELTRLQRAAEAAADVQTMPFLVQGLFGEKLGEAIEQARLQKIAALPEFH